jgi:hypothetical protein
VEHRKLKSMGSNENVEDKEACLSGSEINIFYRIRIALIFEKDMALFCCDMSKKLKERKNKTGMHAKIHFDVDKFTIFLTHFCRIRI